MCFLTVAKNVNDLYYVTIRADTHISYITGKFDYTRVVSFQCGKTFPGLFLNSGLRG